MTVIGDLPDHTATGGGISPTMSLPPPIYGGASPIGATSGGVSPIAPPDIPGQFLQVS